jgi:hypothetical protein
MKEMSARTRKHASSIAIAWAVMVTCVVAEPPAATPSPSPTPEAHLRLNIEEHAQASAGSIPDIPRFETEVVGRTPQEMLQRFLDGGELECGPTTGGAPTVADTRAYREHPSPSVDFMPLVQALFKAAKGLGPDRFFLYRVARRDGNSYLVREGRMPASQLYEPGAMLELVAAFPDRATATRAWRRMERGFKTPVAPASSPAAQWATTNCTPGHK